MQNLWLQPRSIVSALAFSQYDDMIFSQQTEQTKTFGSMSFIWSSNYTLICFEICIKPWWASKRSAWLDLRYIFFALDLFDAAELGSAGEYDKISSLGTILIFSGLLSTWSWVTCNKFLKSFWVSSSFSF